MILVSNTPFVDDQATTFGALTRSQRGDFEPIHRGGDIQSITIDSADSGTASHFEANSGRIRVSSSGVGNLSGPYVLNCTATGLGGSKSFKLTITIEQDVYSISPFNDGLLDILSVSAATLNGKTIKLRPGDYTKSTVNHFGKHLYTSTTTFTAHDRSRIPVIPFWQLAGSGTPGNIVLSYLRMFKSYGSVSGGSFFGLGNTGSCAHVLIDQVICESDLYAARLGCTLPGSSLKTFLNIQVSAVDDITIQNVVFRNGCHAIGLAGTNLTVKNCHQHHCWGDFIDITSQPNGDATDTILVENNLQRDCIADTSFVHPDFVQGFPWNDGPSGTMRNGTVRGNVQFHGLEGIQTPGSVASALQFMIMQHTGTGTYENWLAEGNVSDCAAVAGISFEGDLIGTNLFKRNTLVRPWYTPSLDASHGFPAFTAPTIRTKNIVSGMTTSDSNVLEGYTQESATPPTITNDYTSIARSNVSTYEAVFNGPDFFATSRSEMLSKYRAKAGAALATGSIGALGATEGDDYYDFSAWVDPEPVLDPRVTTGQ